MRSLYEEDAYFSCRENTGYEDYTSQENSLRTTFRRFLYELKERGMTSGRLLEVGCGYGYFLDEAKNFFSHVAGTELSVKAGAHARQHTGAEVFTVDISALPPNLNNFDLIVLINVIEHVYAPVEFVMTLKRRLAKGGKIVIATPDIGSFWYRIMKRNWPSFKIPEHVAFYAEKTLKFLLEKSGFHHINRIPFRHAFPFGLIASKLGVRAHRSVSHQVIWLPKTMIALSAEVK